MTQVTNHSGRYNEATEVLSWKGVSGLPDNLAIQQKGTLFCEAISVTRLGDLLDFGQLFKAFGNN